MVRARDSAFFVRSWGKSMSDNDVPPPLRFFRIMGLPTFSPQAIDSQWLTSIFFYCNYLRGPFLEQHSTGNKAHVVLTTDHWLLTTVFQRALMARTLGAASQRHNNIVLISSVTRAVPAFASACVTLAGDMGGASWLQLCRR